MKLDTIGKNIRKFREIKKLRQEDLAEKTDLTTNYIGMIERGEKIPSLETFINILNSLGVSADMVLSDVLDNGYTVKDSLLNEILLLVLHFRNSYCIAQPFFLLTNNFFLFYLF